MFENSSDASGDAQARAYWGSSYGEPLPFKAKRRTELGMFGEPELVKGSPVCLGLRGHPQLQIEYRVARQRTNRGTGCPLLKVSARLVAKAKGKTIGYATFFVVGPKLSAELLEQLPELMDTVSQDLSGALQALIQHHVQPPTLLQYGLLSGALAHLEMLEVAKRHQGKGLGVLLVSTVLESLQPKLKIGLLSYRPFPCQFLQTGVLACAYSNAPRAVSLYTEFVEASARLSRHYAKHWSAMRIPSSDYFLATVGSAFSLAFNAPLEQWALLPDK